MSGKQKAKRNRNKIRAWLLLQGIDVRRLAERVGVCESLASRTLGGENNNRRVLRALVEIGCPKRLLMLPPDMEKAA